MRKVSVGEAARGFMAILKAAEDGEDVVITRAGRPVARLIRVSGGKPEGPIDPTKPRFRSLGWRDHS